MAKRFSSTRSKRSGKNLRKGGGPLHYSWKPLPMEKNKNGKDGYDRLQSNSLQGCNGPIDNIVTYVFEILPDGNHEAYVDCDYVE
jgi:hypothetical protein